jgi:hypothetical protein
MNNTLAGAVRSKTIWLNVFLAVFSAVELSSAHLTTLWGSKVAAAVLFAGSLVNVALRAYTTTSLADKVDG